MLVDEWPQKNLVCKTVAINLYAINNDKMSSEIYIYKSECLCVCVCVCVFPIGRKVRKFT